MAAPTDRHRTLPDETTSLDNSTAARAAILFVARVRSIKTRHLPKIWPGFTWAQIEFSTCRGGSVSLTLKFSTFSVICIARFWSVLLGVTVVGSLSSSLPVTRPSIMSVRCGVVIFCFLSALPGSCERVTAACVFVWGLFAWLVVVLSKCGPVLQFSCWRFLPSNLPLAGSSLSLAFL